MEFASTTSMDSSDDQKELFKRGMGEEASAFGSNDVLELGRTLLQLEEVLDGVCREASTKSGKSGTLGDCVEDVDAAMGVGQGVAVRLVVSYVLSYDADMA